VFSVAAAVLAAAVAAVVAVADVTYFSGWQRCSVLSTDMVQASLPS